MSYVLFTDSSANLTPDLVKEWDVRVISLHYQLEGEDEKECFSPAFDAKAFYDALRSKKKVRTSMINSAAFEEAFSAVLAEGKDVLYVGMSSGISSTISAATTASEELMQQYPGRKIRVVDTLGASFGEGFFVERASRMHKEGKTLEECAAWIEAHVQNMNQYLAVDNLMFLRQGGRISGLAAVFGSLARIKPVLFGNSEGKFNMADRSTGRKKSLKFLADRYFERCIEPENNTLMIAHADCEADCDLLVRMIRDKFPNQDILVRCYEPGTGAHTGPDAIAIFFYGKTR